MSLLDEMRVLTELRNTGAISEEEYNEAASKVRMAEVVSWEASQESSDPPRGVGALAASLRPNPMVMAMYGTIGMMIWIVGGLNGLGFKEGFLALPICLFLGWISVPISAVLNMDVGTGEVRRPFRQAEKGGTRPTVKPSSDRDVQ